MTWSNEIAGAYSLGLEDGKAGRMPRQDQKFHRAYCEGYLHGRIDCEHRQDRREGRIA
jgi:hypothetical protein